MLEDKIAALNNNTLEADNNALQKELQQLRSSSNEVEQRHKTDKDIQMQLEKFISQLPPHYQQLPHGKLTISLCSNTHPLAKPFSLLLSNLHKATKPYDGQILNSVLTYPTFSIHLHQPQLEYKKWMHQQTTFLELIFL